MHDDMINDYLLQVMEKNIKTLGQQKVYNMITGKEGLKLNEQSKKAYMSIFIKAVKKLED